MTGAGITTPHLCELENGNTIAVASDGVWDNITKERIAEIIKDTPQHEAIKIIYKECLGTMSTSDGKPDNISLLLYELKPQH